MKTKKKAKVEKVNLGKKGSFKIHKGALHQALGIPMGQKIGQTRMHAALQSDDPEIRRMAASGIGLSHMAK